MTGTPLEPGLRKRSAYLDLLRIAAAFLVIVNHTNSDVFQASTPAHGTWHVSVLWYYISKTAVPLFVMISGACLLPKLDGYRKMAKRVFRSLAALLLFSYLYFLYDAWVNYGLWPRAVDFASFFSLIWTRPITDAFWYLYFYLGLLIMLPILQRLEKGMRQRDLLYLIGVSFLVYAIWPLLTHYAPSLILPGYLDMPLFAIFIGLFFAGHYVHKHVSPNRRILFFSAVALVVSLAISLLLTWLEYQRVPLGAKYWFMDDRLQPSILTIISALSLMVIAKYLLCSVGVKASARLAKMGSCAFGIYLLQDLVIAETKLRLFHPLCAAMPSFLAALFWELVVFLLCFAVTWVLRLLPAFRKLL